MYNYMSDVNCLQKVNERFKRYCTEKCLSCPYFQLQYHSLNKKDNTQKFFEQNVLIHMGIEQKNGSYHGDYRAFEYRVIYYCRNTYVELFHDLQKQNSQDLSSNNYEDDVKKILKATLDVAARATKIKNPELSIMFDGIGLILADELVEAVDKVISMLDTAMKAKERFS